ncbi:MAG: acetylxylan esterase [Verrucomicrobiota bacterium]
MAHRISFPLVLSSLLSVCQLSFAAAFPSVSQLPAQPGLPDPLIMLNGERVTTAEQWRTKRRPELKALFEHYMYGHMPPAQVKFVTGPVDKNYFQGKATKKEVSIDLGPGVASKLQLLVVVPNRRQAPAPAFVGLNFCGNHALLADKSVPLPKTWVPNSCLGCSNNMATDAGRGTQVETWALEQSIDRGYAVAVFYNGDVEPDRPDATGGVRAAYRDRDWGAIAAWAWGLSRAVDYLVTDPDIDAKHIAVVGHSRNGKAALVAAAFDERIALAIPLQAGCGGTAPSRGTVGESVKQINDRFPHWFNAEFKKFNEATERLPFDQHCLVALCAPRPVLLPNALEDQWANPTGQFQVLQAAEPVYRLLGAGGLEAKQMPEIGRLVDSTLGYYIRPGKHSMTSADWLVFLDYTDKQFGKPK